VKECFALFRCCGRAFGRPPLGDAGQYLLSPDPAALYPVG
jgi:hypothetical protein